ncbi:MAG: heavy metal-binding domain-containing protein [Syntrophobacteraceae bacterium]
MASFLPISKPNSRRVRRARYMVKNAVIMHANVIVMMRFDSPETGQTMSEIVALRVCP